jgi:deoxycytidine triphosphate deaminase
MEFVNMRRFHPQRLYPGLLVGQMVFTQMLGAPLTSYAQTGRYNGDLKVTTSKG